MREKTTEPTLESSIMSFWPKGRWTREFSFLFFWTKGPGPMTAVAMSVWRAWRRPTISLDRWTMNSPLTSTLFDYLIVLAWELCSLSFRLIINAFLSTQTFSTSSNEQRQLYSTGGWNSWWLGPWCRLSPSVHRKIVHLLVLLLWAVISSKDFVLLQRANAELKAAGAPAPPPRRLPTSNDRNYSHPPFSIVSVITVFFQLSVKIFWHWWLGSYFLFLVACTRLYNPLCRSVGRSVRP